MAGELNPGFTFDAGDVRHAPAWEFGGALRQALSDHNMTKASLVQDKIQAQLRARGCGKRKAPPPAKAPHRGATAAGGRGAAAAGGSSDSGGEEEEEEEEVEEEEGGSGSEGPDSEEDEDAPLPGELGSDEDSEGEGVEWSGNDDDDDDDGGGRGGGGGGEATAGVGGRRAPPLRANGAPASAAVAAAPAGVRGGKGKGKLAAAAPAAKRGDGGGGADKKATRRAAESAPPGTSFSAGSFQDLHLSRPLLRACSELGYTQPTPIQAACIPLALSGRDVCGSAVTGSGKTAAYALPILERLLHRPRHVAATYVIILAPTRELAVQIQSMVTQLARFTNITAALIVGGLSLQVQAAALRKAPDIVVASPGRLIDHLRNTASFGLEDVAVLVLDEADRLLECGFADEVGEILGLAPRQRQTLLFSATWGEGVQRLAALSLRQPVRLAADAPAVAPAGLTQEVVRLKGAAGEARKEAVLLAFAARALTRGRAIVFTKTKQRAHRLALLFGLAQLPAAAELHGDMTQAARLESLERFRTGDASYLIATDVAARGLDILGVQVVVNFDAPRTLDTYMHRVGRTARAGARGLSVTFAEDGDRALLRALLKTGRAPLRQRIVPPEAVAQWERRLEGLEAEVGAILRQEREEAALRHAEMEANKAQNLLDHESEILSRPPRTWFQSERERKAARGRRNGDDADGGGAETNGDGGGGGGRGRGQGGGEEKGGGRGGGGGVPAAARERGRGEEEGGRRAGRRQGGTGSAAPEGAGVGRKRARGSAADDDDGGGPPPRRSKGDTPRGRAPPSAKPSGLGPKPSKRAAESAPDPKRQRRQGVAASVAPPTATHPTHPHTPRRRPLRGAEGGSVQRRRPGAVVFRRRVRPRRRRRRARRPGRRRRRGRQRRRPGTQPAEQGGAGAFETRGEGCPRVQIP